MKKLLLITLSVLFSILAFTQTTKYVNATNLNVREQASTEAEVIYSLKQNDKVTVIETENAWSHIQFIVDTTSYEEYIYSMYLGDTKVK